MVRVVLRYLVLLLGVLAGCAAPLQHPFPLNQPDRPAAVALVAWRSTLLFTDGRMLCGAVLVAPDTALTARHCILPGFKGGLLVHPDGQAHIAVQASVASDADIAFLRIAPTARQYAQLGRSTKGTEGYVLGYGCSSGRRLDARPVVQLGSFIPHLPDDFLFDAWEGTACKGDSGGGVFDAQGRLLGINVRIADDDSPMLFTIPAEAIAPALAGQL